MDEKVKEYLARIGRSGGRKSRRVLDSATAREMVRVREARRAFRRYHLRCFWSYDPDYEISPSDVEWVAYSIEIDLNHPGYVRAVVEKRGEATKVEWAHDSAWRFLPTVKDERVGFILHPVDLAINKTLALAGREEARDVLDILHFHRNLLILGALCWAACGKDPGSGSQVLSGTSLSLRLSVFQEPEQSIPFHLSF